ncbi:MAG: AAA family ATPase [Myxococcota bacterium]
MIEGVTIRNFRSIRELDAELAPFSVLVGPNGAGKTNVVQALETLGRMIDVGSTDPLRDLGWDEVRWRGTPVSRGGITLGATLDLRRLKRIHARGLEPQESQTHHRVALKVVLTGSADGVDVLEEDLVVADGSGAPLGRFSAQADRPPVAQIEDPKAWEELGIGHAQVGVGGSVDPRFLRIFGPSSPFRSLVRGSLLVWRFRFDTTSLRSDAPHPSHELLGSGENLARAVLNRRGDQDAPNPAFSPILDGLRIAYPRIKDVRARRVGPNRFTLQFKERGVRHWLDQSSVSDGVLHALALLLVLLTRGQGVTAIEEPENALHPWAARALIELAQNQQSRQVLVTTHSETVVSAIGDPRSLFLVERGDRGTTVERATDREQALEEILRESGQKLGDVWIDGSLGGVPEGPV